MMATADPPVTEPPTVSAESEDDKEELQMPTPPRDYEFNSLLVKIAKKMTDEDLEKAKAIFKGAEGLGRNLLSEIKTPLELFDSLQKHTFLDRNNLLYLQALLYNLERIDLYDMAIDYAQSIGDVIYFCKPPKEPPNGYKYVQFHIEGTDFKRFKRQSLEAMRATAARLMFVPPQFVLIAGIEPSSSLLITFMVPEKFIKYLQRALEKKVAVEEMTNQGIDVVYLCDVSFNLYGVEDADIIETEEQTKLKTIYEQLQSTNEKLEETEIECMKLKRKLDDGDSNKRVSVPVQDLLVKLLFETNGKRTVSTLLKQSAYAFFSYSLKLVRRKNYDKETIDMLLDAHASVLSVRVRETDEIRFKALLLENQSLKASVFHLQVSNMRLRIFHELDSTLFQKRLQEALQSAIPEEVFQVQQEIIQFDPFVLQLLKEISDKLSDEEKRRLLDAYSWPEKDVLTKQMKREGSIILAYLVAKEIQQTGKKVALEEFIAGKLADIKRDDLRKLFIENVKTHNLVLSQLSKLLSSGLGGIDPQQTKSGHQEHKLAEHQSKTEKHDEEKSSTAYLDDRIDLLIKKVTNIEEMVHSAAYKTPSLLQPDFFTKHKFDSLKSLY